MALVVADRLGTVEAGRIADLIALGRNPREDIRACHASVRFVMWGGTVARGDGLVGRGPVATKEGGMS